MSDNKAQAQAAKARGNTAFTAKNFDVAVTEFTAAIALDPTDHVFFSNRSGAYASLNRFEEALADANQCITLKPDFIKGYSRKGTALHGAGRLKEAVTAYEDGLKLEAGNAQLKEGLDLAQKDLAAQASGGAGNPFGQLFGPSMWAKLEGNPKTKAWLASDPTFRSKMQLLSSNPQLATQLIQSDAQVQEALSVILGGFPGAGGDRPAAPGATEGKSKGGPGSNPMDTTGDDDNDEEEEEVRAPPPRAAPKAEAKAKKEAPKAPEPQTEEEKAARDRMVRSEEQKKKGNEFYNKKDFDKALEFYNAAIEVEPTNASAYLNVAAVHFERKNYDKTVEFTRKVIEIAREHQRGFEVAGKAYLRMGNAFMAQKKYGDAIDAYQKSLLEEKNDKAHEQLKKAQTLKAQADREAYIDPARGLEHKNKGNAFFGEGKWVEAIGEYDEAVKRDPTNPTNYSNRAACFQKLMDWGRALEDCETAIKLDPNFVKAYARLGKIQHFLKQYHKAIATFDKGLSLQCTDAQKTELLEAKAQTSAVISAENRSGNVDPARAREAMKDPEIQAILKDPTINKVLQDMQENPASAQSALADPTVRGSIEKLIAAGILQVGSGGGGAGRRGARDE